MNEIYQNIKYILNKTDVEFLQEINNNVYNNFINNFFDIKKKNILYINDIDLQNENYQLLQFISNYNKLIYFDQKKKIFFDHQNKSIVKKNKIRKNDFDYILVPCIVFNENGDILVNNNVKKIIKKINYKKIICYAFGIQLFNFNDNENNILKKAMIVSNNFIVK